MERRRFLLALAAGVLTAAGGRGITDDVPGPGSRPAPEAAPSPAVAVRGVAEAHVAAGPPTGVVDVLPGDGRPLALTIDDGTDSEVVGAFAEFARDSGVRLTFFPNGCYSAWKDNAPALQPLVDSGQVAMGNHTWSHPDLTMLDDAAVAEELRRNKDFLRDVFGIRDTPFMRPPFGSRNERIDHISADLGHPTIAMWNGTLADAGVVEPADLVRAARQWFTARSIIVGHANQPAVTRVYGELLELIEQRDLTTVTLADVWATDAQRLRGAAARGRVVPG